ncbi:hypothetical protein HZB89_01920, partial [archaeon]|nr:hypothetical protein [archaeon]
EETSLQGISGRVLDYAKKCLDKTDSFKVDARRAGKHEFSSLDIAIACSEAITEKFGGKINLSKPGKTIYVEVRQDNLFIYLGEAEGFDGLPSGVSGNLLEFFSGERNEAL